MRLVESISFDAIAARCGANPVTRNSTLVGTKKEVSNFIKDAISAYKNADTLESFEALKLQYRLALTPSRLTDVKKSVAVEKLRKELIVLINAKHKFLTGK